MALLILEEALNPLIASTGSLEIVFLARLGSGRSSPLLIPMVLLVTEAATMQLLLVVAAEEGVADVVFMMILKKDMYGTTVVWYGTYGMVVPYQIFLRKNGCVRRAPRIFLGKAQKSFKLTFPNFCQLSTMNS